MTTEKEITLLFPQGKEVTLNGKAITIKPFGFGKFPRLLKLIKGIDTGDKLPASVEGVEDMAKTDILSLITDNAETVVEICALATNLPTKAFDEMPPDEAVDLVQAIVEVNADFFIRRLQPKLLGAMSGLTQSLGGALSQGLSPPATA